MLRILLALLLLLASLGTPSAQLSMIGIGSGGTGGGVSPTGVLLINAGSALLINTGSKFLIQ